MPIGILEKTSKYSDKENSASVTMKYLRALSEKYRKNDKFFVDEDPEVLEVLLKKTGDLLKNSKHLCDSDIQNEMKEILLKHYMRNPEFR